RRFQPDKQLSPLTTRRSAEYPALASSPSTLRLAAATLLAVACGCAGPGRSPWTPVAPSTSANNQNGGQLAPVVPGRSAGGTTTNQPGSSSEKVTIRGQSQGYPSGPAANDTIGGYTRQSMPVSGGPPPTSFSSAPVGTGTVPGASAVPGGGVAAPTYGYQPLPLPPAPPADAMAGIAAGGISPIVPGCPGFQPPTNVPPE